MPTNRKVIDLKIHNLTEEQFQELKEAGQIDPNAIYCTPDETVANFKELNERIDTANEQINTKQDIATAINYGHVTNCLTEIPQDIKLELNNGILTLKAGSKLTDPTDGTQNTTIEDKTGTLATNGQYMVFAGKSNGNLQLNSNYTKVAVIGSGSSLPADGSTYRVFYNTTNNTINRWTGAAWVDWAVGLPLGIITVSDGAISSIDQVFNGFGYIGSTIFALPGVKGLIPNGRNADGSLNNIQFVVEKPLYQNISAPNLDVWSVLRIENGEIALRSTGLNTGGYNPNTNYNVFNDRNSISCIVTREYFDSNDRIKSFTPKSIFHAVDYSDLTDKISIAVPAGIVTSYAGSTPPAGWLKCDGSAVSRERYAELFARIGTLYGTGDGSTTFNLPNLQGGRVPVGMSGGYVGQSTNGVLPNITGSLYGAKGGSNPSGTGAIAVYGQNYEGTFGSGGGQYYNWDFNASRSNSMYGNGWFDGEKVIPASVGMTYCIKY